MRCLGDLAFERHGDAGHFYRSAGVVCSCVWAVMPPAPWQDENGARICNEAELFHVVVQGQSHDRCVCIQR